MQAMTDLIEGYIASWNESDPARRRALVARTFTEGATYLDPMMQGEGHAGIEAMIAAVQDRFPGLRFRLAGKVDSHHDRLRFSWELAPPKGAALARGTDFGVVAADGRLQSVTGFLDMVPGQ
ncbi:MAG: nuclear transport factor 2 family protein [Acetobacteraceae bacterium]|nr:nuclear transport factor 2 family protein [Acetobacteraceae bacterium]